MGASIGRYVVLEEVGGAPCARVCAGDRHATDDARYRQPVNDPRDDVDELRRAGRWHDVVRVLTTRARAARDIPARVRDLNEAGAVLLARFGNHAEAARCWEASLALDPEQPEVAAALHDLRRRRQR